MGHVPGGVSLKNLAQFAQSGVTGKFSEYDYDMDFMATKTNWDEYDQAKPPELDLKNIRNITVPVALITGK